MRTTIGAAVAALALAACSISSQPTAPPDFRGDDAIYRACDELARWANEGQPGGAERLRAFGAVQGEAEESDRDAGMTIRARRLVRSVRVDVVDEDLVTMLADDFSNECLTRGYGDD